MVVDVIEGVAEVSADALDKTIETSREITLKLSAGQSIKKAEDYWNTLGPGLTTGAADDDPSGIATYSQTGAQYGLQLLWLAGFTFPLMAIVQEMCARIGLVTGRGLAANIKLIFPRWALYFCTALLFIANTINIGADLGAMAKAIQLLVPSLSFGLLVIGFTVICLSLQIFISYKKYAKYLKWLTLVLLSYIATAFLLKGIDWRSILAHTFVPSLTFSKEQVFLICAILGTTISPYLFFWQTSQEVEEEILEGKITIKLRQSEISKKEIKKMRLDVWSGMFLSNLVMFFIIVVAAGVLFTNGITNIRTAADAAEALRPLAGEYAYLLFTLGIIGTGMLAVPILAGSASYALSESFGWKYGLYKNLKQAKSFYGIIILSTLVGLLINFVGIDAMKALIYSAVVNGIVAPIILVLIVLLSSNKRIMENNTNHPVITFIGWITVGIMSLVSVATIVSLFLG